MVPELKLEMTKSSIERAKASSPPATTTFPNYVFGLQGGIIRPEVAAMATVVIGMTLVATT